MAPIQEMSAVVIFDFPLGWQVGLPVAAVFLAFTLWLRRRHGLAKSRMAALAGLRAMVLLVLVFLVARPVWLAREPPGGGQRSVVVLVDRSESMSLAEQGDRTRYQQALEL